MILHIVKKDARRLWPVIAGSLVLLATLAWQDRGRADWLPGAAEGYLNLLMPFVWACLVALAVEQEPLAGDRQFWLTRPYRRPELLASKLLFAALFVHVPALIADCYILMARGFSPIQYLPHLVWKQVLFACALTIPAMALASLVRNFSHFVLEMVALAVLFFVLGATSSLQFYTWEPLQTVRSQLIVLVGAFSGAAILAIQYLGRRILLSRGIAIAAGVCAALVFSYLMPPSALAVRVAVSPARADLALRLDLPRPGAYLMAAQRVTLGMPISVVGLPEGLSARVDIIRSEVIGAGGVHYTEAMGRYDPFRRPAYTLYMNWDWADGPSKWMTLNTSPAVFGSLGTGPITIRGEASLMVYRPAPAAWMPVGVTAVVPGAGRCATQEIVDPFTVDRLKVECESPGVSPYRTRVRVWSPETGQDWKSSLGAARPGSNAPAVTWLSPVLRDVTYFEIGAQYLGRIPPRLAPTAKIEITPLEVVGYSAVKFEFRDIDPKKYALGPNYGAVR